MSGGDMEWSDGMIYPVLHRLEKENLIVSDWVMSDDSRPRKYYEITEQGKLELEAERQQWSKVNEVLDMVWKGQIPNMMPDGDI